MILQKNYYVYVWCGNFHTDLRFRPKCIPFLNINFLLYFNFLVHRTLSIKIFSFQKFILQCKYFQHNNTVECSLWIQLSLLALWVFSQERDLRFGPCISDKSTSTVSNFWVELTNLCRETCHTETSEERRLYSQAKQVETSWKGH